MGTAGKMDQTDTRILDILQADASLSAKEVADLTGLDEKSCADRIRRLEDDGVIVERVSLLDPRKVGANMTVFVAITTPEHSREWLDRFHDAVEGFPEVMEFYRMSGQVDYLLRVVVPDIDAYDRFYKKLIAAAKLKDVSSTFAIEQIKYTTKLPLKAAD
jgi:Lrp/AsnC family transcriptional regulator